jgi:hypothetical protein
LFYVFYDWTFLPPPHPPTHTLVWDWLRHCWLSVWLSMKATIGFIVHHDFKLLFRVHTSKFGKYLLLFLRLISSQFLSLAQYGNIRLRISLTLFGVLKTSHVIENSICSNVVFSEFYDIVRSSNLIEISVYRLSKLYFFNKLLYVSFCSGYDDFEYYNNPCKSNGSRIDQTRETTSSRCNLHPW